MAYLKISDYSNTQENANEITKNLAYFPRNAITSRSIPVVDDNKPLSQLPAPLPSAVVAVSDIVESVVGTVHKQCQVGQSLMVAALPLAHLEATGSLLKR